MTLIKKVSKNKIIVWIKKNSTTILIGLIIAFISYIGGRATNLYKSIASPEYLISSGVCSSLLEANSKIVAPNSNKNIDVDIKVLNNVYVVIENKGTKPQKDVSILIRFFSEKPSELLYVMGSGSSAGSIQDIHEPKIDLNQKTVTFRHKLLNPKEIVLFEIGIDRPVETYVELRNLGLTLQKTEYPGCKQFDTLRKIMNGEIKMYGGSGLNYYSDRCKKENNKDGFTCTLTSTSEEFNIPKDFKPGDLIVPQTTIKEERFNK
jgi:hypothetical protein